MPRRTTTPRTAPQPPITTPRPRRQQHTRQAAPVPAPEATPAPEPTPEPTPAASPTVAESFQQRVQALLAIVAQGEDAVVEAVRRGVIRVRVPRAASGGSRAPRNNGLACTPRQGSFLLYCEENGQFAKGTSKVRAELHRLGLTDSDAPDAHVTAAGRAACEALRAAGVTAGGWQVQR